MVDGQVGRERGLRRAAREDRHALALGSEVGSGDPALEGGELVADHPAERGEASEAGAKRCLRGGASHY